MHRLSRNLALAAALAALPTAATRAQDAPPRAQPDPPPPGADVPAALAPEAGSARAFVQPIPNTVVSLELLPVAPGLWMARTETTWDAYDVFVFGLDRPAEPATDAGPDAPSPQPPPDAVLRPSKPHMVTDRGWGHAGFPAMSISAKGAAAFCEWLSSVTGRRYRLPTEAEWEAACRAGSSGAWSCGDDVAALPAHAWYRENSGRRTRAAATRAPNALGLFDLHGNVGEWCLAPDGTHVLRGGSFRDPSKDLRCDARLAAAESWNQSDPNLPRSVWWLADAPFAGFRVVCEGEPGADGAPRAEPPAR
jgi:formylglycine-generating enzyme required for sulfatase activity